MSAQVTDRVVPPRERLSLRIDERVMSLFKQQCVDDAYIAYWKIKNSFVLCESLKKRKYSPPSTSTANEHILYLFIDYRE